jgi:hypothetical protein
MSNFLEGMTFNPKTGRYIAELQARVDELEALLREGFDSTDDHDLDEWEIRVKKVLDGSA